MQRFDEALQRHRSVSRSDANATTSRDAIVAALLAFGDYSGPLEGAAVDALSQVLQSPENLASKAHFAACLVRALELPVLHELHEQPLRPFVVRSLDSELEDLLPGQTASAQGHERLEQYARLYRECDGTFREALRLLTSLDRVGAHRQALMKALNQKTAKALLRPFLPPDLEARVGELFSRIELYANSRSEPSVVDAHARAGEEGKALAAMLRSVGTEHAVLLAESFERLDAMITEEFSKNIVAQPACLRLKLSPKPYPLRPGAQNELPLVVHNDGPGYAEDVALILVANAPAELMVSSDLMLGRMPPFTEQRVEVAFSVKSAADRLQLLVQASWRSLQGPAQQLEESVELRGQREDVDWARAKASEPYSLEPVESADDLMGRREALSRLMSLLRAENAGSAIIHGQKRVGKTSLARALQSQLQKEAPGFVVVYLESGDYVEPSADRTVEKLGTLLCRRVRQDLAISELELPHFEQALAPLAPFLEEAVNRGSGRRVLFVLDEFDELPSALYARDGIGNSFFLTLRSITSRPSIGCILIGGEKLGALLDMQGEKLNKWAEVPVDYFDRQSDWTDYIELVQRPVSRVLDFDDEALVAIYDASAGNPYFTKLICQKIFAGALAARDCFVTQREVERAVQATVRETGRNAFQHFWDDGLLETGQAHTDRSVRRRRILIALADVLSKKQPCTSEDVQAHPLVAGGSVAADLREFYRRKILKGDTTAGVYDFKVPLFLRWLRERGVGEIISTVDQWDDALERRKREEDLRIRPQELIDVAARWGSYRGLPMNELVVRRWLDQFPTVEEQRLMLRVLQSIRFFSHAHVRKKLLEVDGVIRRAVRDQWRGPRELPRWASEERRRVCSAVHRGIGDATDRRRRTRCAARPPRAERSNPCNRRGR